MKRLNLIALLLAMCLVFTQACIPAWAEETAAVETAPAEETVPVAETEEAVSINPAVDAAMYIMGSMGIMTADETGSYRENDAITRGELAAVFGFILRNGSVQDSGKYATEFIDVSPKDALAPDIALAASYDVLPGYADRTYRQNGTVSYAELIRAVVVALGYKQRAEAIGGNPTGYLAMASQLDVLHNVKYSAGEEAVTRGTAAVAVYNMLTANYLKLIGYDGVNGIYEDGYTMMEECLGAKKISGQVTANRYTGLYDMDEKTEDNQLAIGGMVYTTEDYTLADYLGYRVTAYVEDNEDEPYPQLWALEVSDKNRVVTLKAEDIISVSKTSISAYNENGKRTSYNLADPELIYNNRAYAIPISLGGVDILKPAHGTVTLVSPNNNDKYTVVSVMEYDMDIVKSVEVDTQTIAFEELGTIKFDADSKNDLYIFLADGTIAENMSKLLVNDVVAVYAYEGVYVIRVLAGKTVEGAVSAMSTKGISVAGVHYEMYADKRAKIEKDASIGSMLTAYLSLDDEIFFYRVNKNASSIYRFGFLICVAKEEGIFNDTFTFKLLDAENGLKEYKLTKNYRLNGCKKGDSMIWSYNNKIYDIKAEPIELDDEYLLYMLRNRSFMSSRNSADAEKYGNYWTQVIKYRLNDQEEISDLYLAYNESASSNDYPDAYDTSFSVPVFEPLTGQVAAGVLASMAPGAGEDAEAHFRIGSALMFTTPSTSIVQLSKAEDKEFKVSKKGLGKGSKGTSTYVIYNLDDNYYAGIIIALSAASNKTDKLSWNSGQSSKFVTEIEFPYSQLGEDDEILEGAQIKFLENGKEKTVFCAKYATDPETGEKFIDEKTGTYKLSNGYEALIENIGTGNEKPILNVGDFFEYSLDVDGYLKGIFAHVKMAEMAKCAQEQVPVFYDVDGVSGLVRNANQNTLNGTEICLGAVRYRNDKTVHIALDYSYMKETDLANASEVINTKLGSNVYAYDVKTGEIEVASADDVAVSDFVFLRQNKRGFQDLVIFQNLH